MLECNAWKEIFNLHEALLSMTERSASALVDLLNSLLLSSHRFQAATAIAACLFLEYIKQTPSTSCQFLSSKVSCLLHSKFPHEAAILIEGCFGIPENIIALANRIRSARARCKRQGQVYGKFLSSEVASAIERYLREYLTNQSARILNNLRHCETTLILSIDTLCVMADKRRLASHDEHITDYMQLNQEVDRLIASAWIISEIPEINSRLNKLKDKILSIP
jgi:hypothetical protein